MEGLALDPLDLLQQIVDHAVLILESHVHIVSLRLYLAFLDSFEGAVALLGSKGVVEAPLNNRQALGDVQDWNLAGWGRVCALRPGALRQAATSRFRPLTCVLLGPVVANICIDVVHLQDTFHPSAILDHFDPFNLQKQRDDIVNIAN